MGYDFGAHTERPAVPICNSFHSLVRVSTSNHPFLSRGPYILRQALLYVLPVCKSPNTFNSGKGPLRWKQCHPFTGDRAQKGGRSHSSNQSIFGHDLFQTLKVQAEPGLRRPEVPMRKKEGIHAEQYNLKPHTIPPNSYHNIN